MVKGSGKSVDVDRSNFFQSNVGMGRVSVSAVLLGNRILSYKPVEASCVAELQEM